MCNTCYDCKKCWYSNYTMYCKKHTFIHKVDSIVDNIKYFCTNGGLVFWLVFWKLFHRKDK